MAMLRARDDYATVAFSPKGARPWQRLGESLLQLYIHNEVWLSLVERYVRDVEAAGSNPVTSTIRKKKGFTLLFLYFNGEVAGFEKARE